MPEKLPDGSESNDDAEFWRVVGESGMPAAETDALPDERKKFEVTQSTIDALSSVIDEGLSLTEATRQLLQYGLMAESFLVEGATLQPRYLSSGEVSGDPCSKVELTIVDSTAQPAIRIIDGQFQIIRKINAAFTDSHKAGIALFMDNNQCTSDVAINALIDQGLQTRSILHDNQFITITTPAGRILDMALPGKLGEDSEESS